MPRRYSEQQFRTAVQDPDVRTLADLCRALGIVPRGGNYESVRAYASELAIDLEEVFLWRRLQTTEEQFRHLVRDGPSVTSLVKRLGIADGGSARAAIRKAFERIGAAVPEHSRAPRLPDGSRAPRTYSDAQLTDALSKAGSYPELCDLLSLRPSSVTHRRLQRRAEALGLAIPAEWSRRGPRAKPLDELPYPVEELRRAVREGPDLAAALRALGETPNATTYGRLRRAIEHLGLPTDHLDPHAWRRRPIEEYLVANRRANSTYLRDRLLEEGLKEHRCERCGLAEWLGEPIPLELDHISGDRLDNRLECIRLLCPNCHARTPTYRGRNIGRLDGRLQPPSDDDRDDPAQE